MNKWEGPRLALVLVALIMVVGGLIAADAAAPKTLGPFAVAAVGLLIFLGRNGFGQVWQRSAQTAADADARAALGKAGTWFAGLCGIAAFLAGLIAGIARLA